MCKRCGSYVENSACFFAPEAISDSKKWRDLLLNPLLSEWVVAVAIDEAPVCQSGKWDVH